MSKELYEIELERHSWNEYFTMGNRVQQVPDALRMMISGQDEEEVMCSYWDLENVIVVQGQLFSAAEPATSVLTAALAGDISPDARDAVMELIHQIVRGTPDEEELARGDTELGERCRARAREGLWFFYRELGSRRRELAESILEVVETDGRRTEQFLKNLRGKAMR